MKIIAILTESPESAGGFNQSINSILQMRELAYSRYDFVVLTTQKKSLHFLNELKIEAEYYHCTWLDMIAKSQCFSSLFRFLPPNLQILSSFEAKLYSLDCDLAYFPAPSPIAATLQKLNFIITIWDLCHRDHPEFPEVRNFGESLARDRYYSKLIKSAYLTVTNSPLNARNLIHRYGIDAQKIITMPFSPSPFLHQSKPNPESRLNILNKHGLKSGFFFYPAEFWPHKNHIRILEALKILATKNLFPEVVFSGSENKNIQHIQNMTRIFNLEKQVHFLGFLPYDEMRSLYCECVAVVMPTYFGPTNLPPLEAWAMNRPLIYSEECRDQGAEAAVYIDPDCATSLADAMTSVMRTEVQLHLIEQGKGRLATIAKERELAECSLAGSLKKFATRRNCWPK